jgi:hypothetical protein
LPSLLEGAGVDGVFFLVVGAILLRCKVVRRCRFAEVCNGIISGSQRTRLSMGSLI